MNHQEDKEMPWYVFLCHKHGQFEVTQPMDTNHTADCPTCGKPGQRVYQPLSHYWDKPAPLFHKDGSYEEKY